MDGRLYTLWGDEDQETDINESLLALIRNRIGLDEDKVIWSGHFNYDEQPVSPELKSMLEGWVSPEDISFDTEDRLKHSLGKGGLDYVNLMERKIRIVDAVVYPNEGELRALLRNADSRMELIPFGGGTSVTGGVSPTGLKKFSIALDLSKFDSIELNSEDGIVKVGAGVKGPELENLLEERGLTLGHFPESFYLSTIGGWIATNAAGQESNRYGKIRDMVVGLEMESPSGTFKDRIVPGESAFFRLPDIVVGSEGTFGIVTKAWLKVHRKPERLYYRAYMFRSFKEGVEALRKKFLSESIPIVSRLSDEDETQLSLSGISNKAPNKLFKRYVEFRTNGKPGSLLISVSDRRDDTKFDGGIYLGSVPARIWGRERYNRPFMYNELLKRGIVAETIETSATWGVLEDIHRSTKDVFKEVMDSYNLNGILMCHSSHQYSTGSALYFTFIFHRKDGRGEVLMRTRERIVENILEKGGSISHHHGIGSLLSGYLSDYKGSTFDIIKTIKSRLDPSNVLVPGILGESAGKDKI